MPYDEEQEYEKLDENYCDEGGHYHPDMASDGKDLYDAYMERTTVPSLDEQMSTPEFRLQVIESWIHNWTPRIQQMEKDIKNIFHYQY
jgi:hypothetical protein